MRKCFFLFFLGVVSLSATAQSEVFSENFNLKNGTSSTPYTFIVSDDKYDINGIFALDKNGIKAYLVDFDIWKLVAKYQSEELPINFDFEVIGTIRESATTFGIIYTDNKVINSNSTFGYLTIDFRNDTSKLTTLIFKLPQSESVISTYTINNRVYIVSLKNNTSTLNIAEFSASDSIKRMQFELFDDNRIYSYLKDETGTIPKQLEEIHLSTILPNSDSQLFYTKSYVKFYPIKDSLRITIDQIKTITQLFTIDLINESISKSDFQIKEFQQNHIENTEIQKSNSYLFDGKLFKVVISKEILALSIFKLKGGKLIKEFISNYKEEITFKNGPIVRESLSSEFGKNSFNYMFCQLCKIETDIKQITSKNFSKKLNIIGRPVAITVSKLNNKYVFELGNVKHKSVIVASERYLISNTPSISSHPPPHNQTYTKDTKEVYLFDNYTRNYFRGVLDAKTLSHINSDKMPELNYDIIKEELNNSIFDSYKYLGFYQIENTRYLNFKRALYKYRGKTYHGVLYKNYNSYRIKEF